MSSDKRTNSSSPVWDRALKRFQDEIDQSNDFQAVIEEGSLQGLLDYAQDAQVCARERSAATNMNRLGPILRFVNDFAAVIAVSSGTDPKMTAIVWGSIRLLISLGSSAGDTLQEIMDMLEELSLTLPRFHRYEKTLPMDESFESTLFEVYTEMICLCARLIHFLRSNPHNLLRRSAWNECQGDFKRTIKRIKRLSAAVETEADLARMKREEEKYLEAINVVKDLRLSSPNQDLAPKRWCVPRSWMKYFWGREEQLEALRLSLSKENETNECRVSALHGMGGVGKTQIALKCASAFAQEGCDVFWVAAENTMTLHQSCTELCRQLKLLEKGDGDDEGVDGAGTVYKFKTWLADANRPWLLVLDNVNDITMMRHIIDNSGLGSVLITTRDFNVAREIASSTFQIQPFNIIDGAQLLLGVVGQTKTSPEALQSAENISTILGGLPLALTQIGRFIAQRKMPIQNFLSLYERHQSRVDSQRNAHDDYEHTIDTVWKISLDTLKGNTERFHKLLAFLEPDSISKQILVQGADLIDGEEFGFLKDELDLLDVEQELLQLALIDKNADNESLSVHRLIQRAVLQRMSESERAEYFCAASKMLSWGFPDHWSKDQGHQVKSWSRCEMCLPHLYHLVEMTKQQKFHLHDAQGYAELLLRCGWYLYERELYTIAESFITSALDTFPSKSTPAYANAVDLSGLIHLDLGSFAIALAKFQQVLATRESTLPPDDPFIAFSLNNVALVQTELRRFDEALSAHNRAIVIRKAKAPDRIGNSYSNLASLQLRMGLHDDAEKTLALCPSLKDFTDETFLATGNPRFSGDMVLLSRIRRAQGRQSEALRLASKALAFRRQILSPRLKTCDSLCDVADMLREQGQLAAAAELLREECTIAEALPEGRGQLARGLWRLATVLEQMGRTNEADRVRTRAWEARAEARPGERREQVQNRDFEAGLCLWMLW